MRLDFEKLPTAQWTNEEALDHLRRTFDREVESHGDLMEPYLVMLASSPGAEHKEIMRSALRQTVQQRYGK